jgi:hypothetical protein
LPHQAAYTLASTYTNDSHSKPVDIEDRTVVVPRKENTTKDESPVAVWPLVESALNAVDADPSTQDAAQAAMESSDGCVTLANYLISQAEYAPKMDYRFKVPLLAYATELAEEDDGAVSIYDPEEGSMFFETADHEFHFDVEQDWTVDWTEVADRVQKGYQWQGVENEVWALDWLMAYQDVPLDDYLVSGDEDETE